MNKLYKKTMLEVTKTLLEKYNLKDEEEIDSGHCYVWAWEVQKKLGGDLYSVELFGSHAFVKIDEKFYDAETINGVTDWRKLKTWFFDKKARKSPENYAKKQSKRVFKKYWEGVWPSIKLA